jgi:uncharacterized membrane protein
MAQVSLAGLALAGLVISIYFTLAYYGRIRNARWVPAALCASEESACVTVLRTPYARVFGVPNSLLGIAYYVSVLLLVARGWASPLLDVQFASTYRVIFPAHALILPSLATVLLGFYLIFALRWKLGVDCPLCYAAHAINLGIFVLLFL